MPRETRIALRHQGIVPPLDIDAYLAAGGFSALRKALSADPETLVAELSRASLRGRGGAGFPTGTKEKSAAAACEECDRYVVCNADEGEPGTFKDRSIMEGEPLLLIEGMLISAWAVGAPRGYIYVRGEYSLAIERLEKAIGLAAERGFLGRGVMGGDFSFELELRLGAGSYLCGEELTLIESLEGKRGYPRIKPPFPAERGLWGKPTLVNNVETLANIPWIVEKGANAYLALGTPSSPGTKIFCLSGDVERPGVYEAEMGLSLRELVEGFGGGPRGGGEPEALLLGGAAGTYCPPAMLDLPLDFDELRKQGLTLGSGAVVVLGKGRSLAASIASLMDFFRHESCGKCVPCRVGTARLAAAGKALEEAPRGGRAELFAAMLAEAESMAKTSLCPLGQSPVLPLRSAARYLADRI